jgi:hypothetical protein
MSAGQKKMIRLIDRRCPMRELPQPSQPKDISFIVRIVRTSGRHEYENDKKAADVLILMSGPHLYVFAESRIDCGQ